MVHIAESTVGRRYGGWYLKNTERAQRVLDDLKNAPLPVATKPQPAQASAPTAKDVPAAASRPKVAWGGVKVTA
jgi:translation initiation factor 3 subunit L